MRKKLFRYSVLIYLLPLILLSCEENPEGIQATLFGEDGVNEGTTFPASMQNIVWKSVNSDGDDFGFYFTQTGLYLWDYRGDSFDNESDCYQNEIIANLNSYSGDIYTFTDGSPLTIVQEGNNLFINSTLYVRDNSRTISSLGPDCSNAQTGNTFPQAFQNIVWQNLNSGQDQIGLYFTNNEIYFWDYRGDPVDNEADCYNTGLYAQIIEYNGNQFTLNISGTTSTATIDFISGTLSISDINGSNSYVSDNSRNISDLSQSCSGNNSGSTFPSEFQNIVWRSLGDGDNEIGFIFDNNSITVWDFKGENASTSSNTCYQSRLWANIISYSGNEYQLTFDGQQYTATIDLQSGTLTYVEGTTTFTFEQDFSRNPSNLTPECQVFPSNWQGFWTENGFEDYGYYFENGTAGTWQFDNTNSCYTLNEYNPNAGAGGDNLPASLVRLNGDLTATVIGSDRIDYNVNLYRNSTDGFIYFGAYNASYSGTIDNFSNIINGNTCPSAKVSTNKKLANSRVYQLHR